MRQGVRAVQLRGIRRQKRGDRVVRYHRATGIRLPDDIPETHPDFVDAWARAEARSKDPVERATRGARSGSVAAVVNTFLLSQDYKQGSEVYRAILRRNCDAIRGEYANILFRAIKRRHIEADLSKLPPNPANARLKTWRKLCKFAVAQGDAADDEAAQVSKRKETIIGHKTWTRADIDTYRERWKIGTVQRACFELLYWTAARTNDAVRLSRSHVGSDGILTFTQSKTGGPAYVPWTAPLPPYAIGWAKDRDAMHESLACLSGAFTIIATANGRARSHKGLSNLIAAAARDAGLDRCTAHGLRKARLTAIAESGGTAHAIMAWGGHKTLQEVEEYTRAAQMRMLVSGTEQVQNDVSLADPDTKTANNR